MTVGEITFDMALSGGGQLQVVDMSGLQPLSFTPPSPEAVERFVSAMNAESEHSDPLRFAAESIVKEVRLPAAPPVEAAPAVERVARPSASLDTSEVDAEPREIAEYGGEVSIKPPVTNVSGGVIDTASIKPTVPNVSGGVIDAALPGVGELESNRVGLGAVRVEAPIKVVDAPTDPVIPVVAEVGKRVAAKPVVEKPAVAPVIVDRPAAARPVVEAVVVEKPIVNAAVAAKPVVEKPAVAPVIVDRPAAARPVVEAVVVEKPIVNAAVDEKPVVEKPAVAPVIVDRPAAARPVVEAVVVEKPIANAAVDEKPVVEKPAVAPVIVDRLVAAKPEVAELGSDRIGTPIVTTSADVEEPAYDKTVVVDLSQEAAKVAASQTATIAPQAVDVHSATVSMSSARTEVIAETVGKVVEAVAAQILVTPALVKGEGEMIVRLKSDVLDGSTIRLAAESGTLSVEISPATQSAQRAIVEASPRLESALAEHVAAFHHVRVLVKKGRQNEAV